MNRNYHLIPCCLSIYQIFIYFCEKVEAIQINNSTIIEFILITNRLNSDLRNNDNSKAILLENEKLQLQLNKHNNHLAVYFCDFCEFFDSFLLYTWNWNMSLTIPMRFQDHLHRELHILERTLCNAVCLDLCLIWCQQLVILPGLLICKVFCSILGTISFVC